MGRRHKKRDKKKNKMELNSKIPSKANVTCLRCLQKVLFSLAFSKQHGPNEHGRGTELPSHIDNALYVAFLRGDLRAAARFPQASLQAIASIRRERETQRAF
jgi:hypothetical protein